MWRMTWQELSVRPYPLWPFSWAAAAVAVAPIGTASRSSESFSPPSSVQGLPPVPFPA